MKYLVLITLTLLSLQGANAQSLSIFNVDTTNFPTVKAQFYAFDATGKLQRPSLGELSLTENSKLQTILKVSCPAPTASKILSSVLVIDVSASMKDVQSGTPKIDIAKAAAQAWIRALLLSESECAITSFDESNYLNQDFTKDPVKLVNALGKLTPYKGTDYDAALIKPMAGGLLVSTAGKYQKIILLISDGLPQNTPHTEQIIAEAKKQNCSIFCITLGLPSPQCMKDFSSQTGGQYFENINSSQEAEVVIQKIMDIATGGDPCSIEWTSVPRCAAGNTAAILSWNSQKVVVNYPSPKNSIAKLVPTPSFVAFKNALQGVASSSKITVTAQNEDFNVTSIQSSHPAFSITPSAFNLPKGQSTTLTVTFIPQDSSYVFGKFTLTGNLCPMDIFASGGFIGKKPNVSTLKLTSPIGGETYIAGSDTLITWEGVPATDSVVIEYSIDNGSSWKTITTTASGLQYLWKNIPKPASTLCKIRIRQNSISANTNATDTLGLTLGEGHVSLVKQAVWSPDGSKVASAGNDGKVIIWDAVTGRELTTCIGHTKAINSVTWSSDGFKIATASDDNTVKIWDASVGKLLLSLEDQGFVAVKANWSPDGSKVAILSGNTNQLALRAKICDATSGTMLIDLNQHISNRPFADGRYITFVSWSPDGSKIALAIGTRYAQIWEASTGTYLYDLSGHSNSITDIEWSPDGTKVVTASYDRTSRIWDANTGTLLVTLTGHTGIINTAVWSPDGSRVATAGEDCTTKIWDATTGKQLLSLCILYDTDMTNNGIKSIAWSPDGTQIATVGSENSAILWDAFTGVMLFRFTGNISQISWNPDGYRVATSSNNSAKIWDATTGNLIYDLRGHNGGVIHTQWSPDGAKVVTTTQSNSPIIWDATSGRLMSVLNEKNEYQGYTPWSYASWSTDGSKIATSWDKTAKIWNSVTGKLIIALKSHKDYIHTVEWSRDGLKLVTASADSTARIWDASTGVLLAELSGHTGDVHLAVWSPDGLKIATASADKTAKIWDATTGALLSTLPWHLKDVKFVSWSPDGLQVATASGDNDVFIWDVAKGSLVGVLSGHTKAVIAVKWSPDGSKIATISADSTAKIWNPIVNLPLLTLSGHTNSVNHVSWSPDGTLLATSSNDKTARIWDVSGGVVLYTLSGHSAVVNTVEWSPDGSQVITGSDDKTVKIWHIKSLTVLQEDISPVFSIVASGAAAKDVDLKQCLVGDIKDTLIQACIQNTGTFALRVDSIQITGANASQFSIVSGLTPFEIPVKSAQTVGFRFHPDTAGIKSALILFHTQAASLRQTIRGEGLASPLVIVSPIIDFGKVPVTTSKDLLGNVLIKNGSSTPLTIQATRHAGPNDQDFSTLNGGGSFTLAPGSTAKVDLKYSPKDLGRTSGRLLFEYDGVGSPATVQLFGEGVEMTDVSSENPYESSSSILKAISLSTQPNPAQNLLQIHYGLREPLALGITLHSLTGQVVQTIMPIQAQQAGQYNLTQDLSNLSNGVYILRLTTSKETLNVRVDVVK